MQGLGRWAVGLGLAWGLVVVGVAPARGQGTAMSIDAMTRMSTAELDALYAGGSVPPIPAGRVKGRALYPDARFGVIKSGGARLVWQGKVFDPANARAVNRFFGIRSVPGRLYQAESWRDGAPALILDYQGESTIYARYRDEIRQVGPGLYLGLMYERTSPTPGLKMYFALEAID